MDEEDVSTYEEILETDTWRHLEIIFGITIVLFVFITAIAGIQERRELIRAYASEKCDDRFGEGNWTFSNFHDGSRNFKVCESNDSDVMYRVEIP